MDIYDGGTGPNELFQDQIPNDIKSAQNFHNLTCNPSVNEPLILSSDANVPSEWVTIHWKAYPRFPHYPCPEPLPLNIELGNLLLQRRSQRGFIRRGISFQQLATLLSYGAGLTENWKSTNDVDGTVRAYPSAGARYPLEIYPVVLKSPDINQALYHYDVKRHFLEELLQGDFNEITTLCIRQAEIASASLVIFITAVLPRTMIKYGGRGYRYALLEAGHLMQNFLLIAEALQLHACPFGGISEQSTNDFLDIDWQNQGETALYAVALD